VRLVAPVEFLPAAVWPEQPVLVRVVELGAERQQRDGLLKREKPQVAVDPAEHLELIAEKLVHLAPGTHVEQAAGQFGPAASFACSSIVDGTDRSSPESRIPR